MHAASSATISRGMRKYPGMEFISTGSLAVSSAKTGQIRSLTSSVVSRTSGKNLGERSLRMRVVGNIFVLLDGKYLMITE